MNNEIPVVSVGLPVFNGEAYLAEAIDSLLGQTFKNLELIVCDNASTDDTETICRERAASDERLRYYRNDTNIGAMKNFNKVVDLARGKYFKWAAHDDVHDETYVERCLEILEREPGVVLVYPRARDIDENGATIREKSYDLRTDSATAPVRFKDLIRNDYTCEAIFGLMRLEELRLTPLLSNYADCDRVLLTEIGLSGRFHEIPDYLFIHREHKDRSVRQFKDRQKRSAWFDPSKAGRPAFPYTREFWGYVGAIRRAKLSSPDRSRCYGSMAWWAAVNLGGLVEDLTFAARYVLRPVKHKFFPPKGRPVS